MNPDYLNISQAEDLKNLREKILYRLLEIFPGFLSWGTLTSAFFLSFFAPIVVAIFIILFDIYWLLKIGYLSFCQITAFFQMKKNLKIDWLKRIKKIEGWEKIYHLIILPFYKEGKEIVETSLKALVDCQYPKEKMIVVLAIEERAGETAQKIAKEIEEEFSKSFFQFLITTHPKNLPREIIGKGSNVNWAIKMVKEKLINPLGISKENILLSIFDVDTRPYPQYFSCLTFHYLKLRKTKRVSFQPIPVYNNNVWYSPALTRVVATSNTFWQMIQQERPEQLVTYSSHSMPFEILERVGYPKEVVSDDSRIFWKSFLYFNGDFRVIPLHYPVSMDAVMSKNLLRTIINQYKQQRRWAWGVENIPYLFFGFLKNKKISLSTKFQHSLNILEGFWSWATASLLIFFLGWLPLILGGEKFSFTLLSYNLPILTRNIMALAMIGMFISAILSFSILPPRPKNFSFLKNLSILLQWLLLPLTLTCFGALPALDAQTRLIFGKYLGFWPTEKIRVDDKL